MDQIKVFIINLKRSPERREEMIRQMNLYGLKYEFFDAVDGTLLPSEVIEKSRTRSNKWYKEDEGPSQSMKLGEIGVALSHYEIYQKIIKENLELAIILEDDINFDERFQEFLKNSADINAVMKQFDLLLLGYCTHDLKFNLPADCSYWGRKKIAKQFYVGFPIRWYWSAIGYVISKKGAELLSEKQGNYPCVTADILTANSPRYGVQLGVLNKPVIWPGHFNKYSTIQLYKDSNNATDKKDANTISKKGFYSGIKYSYMRFKNQLYIEKLKLDKKQYKFISDRY
ncbi:MAG: glycosyltransferase family 25 protein [Ferruginibacter sp.]